MWHSNTAHLTSSIWEISISPCSCHHTVWDLGNKWQQIRAELACLCQYSISVSPPSSRDSQLLTTLTNSHSHVHTGTHIPICTHIPIHIPTCTPKGNSQSYLVQPQSRPTKSKHRKQRRLLQGSNAFQFLLSFIIVWVLESASHRKPKNRNASSKWLSTARNVCFILYTWGPNVSRGDFLQMYKVVFFFNMIGPFPSPLLLSRYIHPK